MFLNIIIIINLFVKVSSYGWLPLLDLKSYNFKQINEIKILNKNLVIWNKNNEIIVQDDACIHRKGPLSEGYIDKNTKNLRCSYHGWEFDAKGNVLSIPQSYNNCKTCNKKKSCNKFETEYKYKQKTYQTKKAGNILWVNMNDTPNDIPYHILDNIDNLSDDVVVVDVPYSMDILLENFFDPAHIPFAHHKLQSERKLASNVNSSVIEMNNETLKMTFEDNTLNNNNYRNGTMIFHNPCHYILNNTYPEIFISKLHIYCVPILPFDTRVFIQQEFKNNITKNFFSIIPKWFKHVITQSFFDSDTMLLYRQEKHLRENNILHNSSRSYITPTSSDYSIHMFHKWKNIYPHKWSNIINKKNINELNRNEIFDRYNRHTKNCKHCNGILNIINKIQMSLPIFILLHGFNSNQYEIIAIIHIYFFLEYFKSYFIFRDYIHNNL